MPSILTHTGSLAETLRLACKYREFHAHCVAKRTQMAPPVGVGANYVRWGQLEYLVLAVLRENMYCEYFQYIEVLYCGY